MTIVRRPSPFGELLSLRQAMDRLFEDSFVRPRPWTGIGPAGDGLALDAYSTDDALVIKAALPGVRPEDVDITVSGGNLTIAGTWQAERDEGEGDYLVREMRRGSVSRTVGLPDGLEPDKASASFENGVLSLRIPKAEDVKPRQIRITPTTDHDPSPNGDAGSAAPADS